MRLFKYSNLDFSNTDDLELFLAKYSTIQTELAHTLFFEATTYDDTLRARLDNLRSLAIFRLAAIEARKFDRYTISEIIEEMIVDELEVLKSCG